MRGNDQRDGSQVFPLFYLIFFPFTPYMKLRDGMAAASFTYHPMNKHAILQLLTGSLKEEDVLSVLLKNGNTKNGSLLHVINQEFLIIKTVNGNLKNDFIVIDEIENLSISKSIESDQVNKMNF
jgi:hypothetical protein